MIRTILMPLFFCSAAYSQSMNDANIYNKVMQQICDCIATSTLEDSTSKKTFCYNYVLVKNYQELKTYGVDTLADAGFKKYYPIYLKRFQGKENSHVDKDDSFVGSFVKQTKLSDGNFEITLISIAEKRTMQFFSNEALNERELRLLQKNKDNIVISYNNQLRGDKRINLVKSVIYLRE